MSLNFAQSGWNILPPATVPKLHRKEHVLACSDFAAGLLQRYPEWQEDIEDESVPNPAALVSEIESFGLEAGLRRFRSREMLRIVWRDLCGLATLADTFAHLNGLAEACLETVLLEHHRRLEEKHGAPRDADGQPQRMFVIGLGKFGGGELNLSSDIDIMFCYPRSGHCDGPRELANEQFFTRQARAVIASLSDVTEDGFCFRVDTRLRPFGDSGPLTSSLAALEQYYQREGRDWERYALVKARTVAGDQEAGREFIESVRPFVYRRYIDYGSVESLKEMHANVQEDARRRDRLDDIKRGPGGIREIEFLAQCFQILRGGREAALQTPSLDRALAEIATLGLLEEHVVAEIRNDYVFLRLLENRIQALRDQQTHRLPPGPDRERIARAMYEDSVEQLEQSLARTRRRVGERFEGIFPARPRPECQGEWTERWRRLRSNRQDREEDRGAEAKDPLALFIQGLGRLALSQRAHQRLDRFMPELLGRLDRQSLSPATLNAVFDLVRAICRRSAYLVLLVQHPKALDRLLELFERSEWIALKVIRFPALLDELIDPALGRHLPAREDLERSVGRILDTAPGTEAVLEGLNYLKLATELRIGVAQLQENLGCEQAQQALSDLASAVLGGALEIAGREIAERHGHFSSSDAATTSAGAQGGMAIIGYGSLGAGELGYDSDLDIVFLFLPTTELSDGARPLPAERYYARMAQRVLSFLTVMTPSGRLYEVDTRLRPNGRAGSLVSNVSAFRDYQMNEAWTWELQALTRARFLAGNHEVSVQFNRVRLDVLCRKRDRAGLAAELLDMRRRMDREHTANEHIDNRKSPKHRPGGLVDIEFIAQLGVLECAMAYPRVIQATGTLPQLRELRSVGWLSADDEAVLERTTLKLRERRMMVSLLPDERPQRVDTTESAAIFDRILGGSARSS
ncbi:MAG: bifunctional [glutamate--ammonia ligase]-adenylyl-L-tyrosine phosphorylase/[glutamate--ammonia-ligase] adenylyltransferase [Lysobacterales bacterium]|jgi:glutamate-ammonia-ligase adenylyltransferase